MWEEIVFYVLCLGTLQLQIRQMNSVKADYNTMQPIFNANIFLKY